VLDEDDAFLALASGEIWEYDVVDNRADEFEAALRNSETVMEFEVLDEAGTESDDAAAVSLSDSSTRAPERRWRRPGGVRGISGARDVDDGPAGRPTVDASAAETGPDRPYLGLDDAEGISTEAYGGVDDLTVVSEDDPSLGLTEHRKTPPKDWAAAAGASRVPDRGVQSDRPTDKSSTLSPDRD
jgi:hypothetical protein